MPVKLINPNNIPEVLARACQVDRHVSYGDISVTRFIDAPQITHLLAHNTVEVDVADRLLMILGTGVHHVVDRAEVAHASARELLDAAAVLERLGGEKHLKAAKYLMEEAKLRFPDAFDDSVITEKTLTISIDTEIGSLELSGTFDKYWVELKKLEDYKVTSVWGYLYEESKKKWYAQLNVYAYMLREHGYEVDEAIITAIFRDWKAIEKARNKDYPPQLAMEIDIPLYSQEKMKKYMTKRAELHLRAMSGDVVDCTPKEMWASNDVFKIKTPGRSKSIKNFTIESKADEFMDLNELKYVGMYKEFHPGERKRCERFCSVASVCPQHQKFLDLKEKLETEK